MSAATSCRCASPRPPTSTAQSSSAWAIRAGRSPWATRSGRRKYLKCCGRCTISTRSRATGRAHGSRVAQGSAYPSSPRSKPMLDAYIYDGLRSPIGRHAGKLAALRPDDLAGEVIKEVVARNKLEPSQISDVVMGCVTQAGEDSRNVARFAALLAGLPAATPGVTVNRLCASGLQAVVDAARAVTCGEGELYLAGGVESMSRAPYVLAKSDTPFSRDVKMYDTTIGARFPNSRFVKQFGNHSMPETGDNVARDFGITREQADEFALASQQKYAKAEAEGFYKGEIHAIELPGRRKEAAAPEKLSADEHPRRDSTMEALAKLRPLFEGGVVTAG